ncbi:DMT family transporter [Erythrobacteraceae bacterium CFH 75059]|uniref:DMT family transporter n=1 Tax=Qipengyuania thermophila TaxID=2509361 RepID=UPI00101EA64C|nr:DMT family transporter [Qipengyuania thermophila]TCD04910.1 DMT family transporter [Erythrobacteraceae bacterium CFH 75059]
MSGERRGVVLAVTGFGLLSVGDAIIKTMAGAWSPLAVAGLRFALGAIGLAALLRWREGAGALRPAAPLLQLGRGACLAGATLCFFSAIFLMPLAEAMALTFISPVVTALLSRPLLGERVPGNVWVAMPVALAGVALVLRPNLLALGWPALLPLASATFFSGMVIANRKSAGTGSPLAMQAYIAVVAAPILIGAAVLGHASGAPLLRVSWPEASVVARCAIVAVTASTAHALIYLGTTRAGAATIAPTTYVQIIIAGVLGWWWFGDRPDAVALAGMALIVTAGLVLWSGNRLFRGLLLFRANRPLP